MLLVHSSALNRASAASLWLLDQPGFVLLIKRLAVKHAVCTLQLEECHLSLRRCQQEERNAVCKFNYEIRGQVLQCPSADSLLSLLDPIRLVLLSLKRSDARLCQELPALRRTLWAPAC